MNYTVFLVGAVVRNIDPEFTEDETTTYDYFGIHFITASSLDDVEHLS